MAAVVINVGPQSPLNRNLERLLDEAQNSGELKLVNRRLREFPKVAAKYSLTDTVYGGTDYQFSSTFLQIKLTLYFFVVGRPLQEQAVRAASGGYTLLCPGKAQPLPQW